MKSEKSLPFVIGVRILSFVVLISSVFFAPWWFSFIFYIAMLFLFENFYEGIFALLLIDLLYGIPEAKFYGFPLVSTLFAVIFYYFVSWFKRYLSFY